MINIALLSEFNLFSFPIRSRHTSPNLCEPILFALSQQCKVPHRQNHHEGRPFIYEPFQVISSVFSRLAFRRFVHPLVV